MPAHEMEDVLRGQEPCLPSQQQNGAAVNGSGDSPVPHVYDMSEEVVISGISARLPESDNMEEFRENLMSGRDMVTEDDRRWQPGKGKYNGNQQDNVALLSPQSRKAKETKICIVTN